MKLSRIPSIILVAAVLISGIPSHVAAAPVSAANPASLPPALEFTLITGGLIDPVFVTNAGDGSHRLFIIQQTGQIRVFKNGSLLPTPFLNIAGVAPGFTGVNSEQGLLGLAFDPNYRTNGTFYITYTTNSGNATFPYTTTLARYRVSSGNPDLANTASGTVLLSIPKKYTNHNGGMVAFGPDGYLYMSMGDGGSGSDPDNNAQNLHTMLGKLLRLDVESTPQAGKKYVIPPTNPFFGSGDANVKQEIWSYGLRNPWRFSFDRSTGNLTIADVGQNVEEEVDVQAASAPGGQNYGWNILEGNLCYPSSANCSAPSGYVPPVAVYDHGTNDSYGCAITGGYTYRGTQFPDLQGVYFYGDYCSGKVFGLIKNANNTYTYNIIASTNYVISSFGEDEDGELYLAAYQAGNIYQIGVPCANPNINVSIHDASAGAYCVPAGGSRRQGYTDVDAGPVKIVSTDGVTPIIASERINLKSGAGASSYSEFMGMPGSKLSDTYLFPWYNNATAGGLASELRFANVGSGSTTVTVTIAGVVRGTYPLGINETARASYTNVDDGPVQIKSSGGVAIVASERMQLKQLPQFSSYTEMLGLSASSTASTKYMFPWYNNTSSGGLDSQLRFGNVGNADTTVTVTIGGAVQGTYPLSKNNSLRISYTDIDNGPVEITSSGGVPIIASERVNLKTLPTLNSYTELMGLPGVTLTETRYVFPIYTDTTASGLEGQLRFGNVGAGNTTVTVKIGGVVQGTYDLVPNASNRVVFSGLDTGPVEVYTTNGMPIIASMRVNMAPNATYSSNAEMMGLSMGTGLGLPGNQLSSSYWFPWYNNATYGGLDSQLRFGLP